MNNIKNNSGLKFLPIIIASVLVLCAFTMLTLFTTNQARAVSSTTITLTNAGISSSFTDYNMPYSNQDVSIQIIRLSDNAIAYQTITDVSTLSSGTSLSAISLDANTTYAINFQGPTFSKWILTVNGIRYNTNYFVFQTATDGTATNLSIGITYSQTQETWFSDTNTI